jgi:hypothetical protein
MNQKYWLIVIVLAGGLHIGCDSGTPSAVKPVPTTAPTTAPSTTQPSASADAPTLAPATQPATSELMINGQLYKFPVAKLRAEKFADHAVARLYTDDPKAALDDDYKGNRYDLQMSFDNVHEPQQVCMASWQYKAASHEYVNAPYGIFLEGMRYQLQPLDASARFLGTMLMVQIDLEGQFLLFDNSDKSAVPKTVFVKGMLLAPIEYKN